MNFATEAELISFGQKIGKNLNAPAVIELVGDVGSGKTTLTRGIAEGLGIKSSITSPSFTISNHYAFAKNNQKKYLVHYDFYRLKEPGLMMDDLAEKIAEGNNVIVIEWGDSVAELLPDEHMVIRFEYDDEGGRHLDVL